MTIESIQIFIVLCVLIFVFIAFVKESFSPDIIALSAMAILLISGILTSNEILKVFSNSGPITVGAMFILSAALERTGCIELMGRNISRFAGFSLWSSLLIMMLVVMFASAFMNNTPVVVVMTPLVIMLAKTMKISASKLLIPLSYAAILGGTCTLIGTSTNILVDGIVQSSGLPPLGMFEITKLGVVVGVVGVTYILLLGRHLLPDRQLAGSEASWDKNPHFFSEVLITKDSDYIDKTLSQAGFSFDPGRCVIDVIRHDLSLRYDLDNLILQRGDRIILETNVQEVLDLRASEGIEFEQNLSQNTSYEQISSRPTIIMQGIVGPRSKFAGRRIGNLNLRRRYGSYILAVHRHDEDYRKNFEDVQLSFGDTVLLEGPEDRIHQLFASDELISLSHIEAQPYRKSKRWIAIGGILSVMLFSALGIASITTMALIASIMVLAFGCLDTDEAYQSIDWRIIFMIIGMLALSLAMEKTGAAVLIVNKLLPFFELLGPIAVLALIYAFTSTLTEMISNNAVAVLIAPIAISIAHQMGIDSRPFIVAVMFGSSAAFATPIGYQTNTFVYSAGNYKFSDFIKVGMPLNIILFIVAVIFIPLFWPF